MRVLILLGNILIDKFDLLNLFKYDYIIMNYRFKIEEKISETLADFKILLPRYVELKNNERMSHLFFSRNRNPLWDLSGNKMLKTGLKSSKLITEGGVPVHDHLIQRTRAMRIIFQRLELNPTMTYEDFTKLLLSVGSTVLLTKKEHALVTSYSQKHNVFNYEVYELLGIEINGLSKFLEDKTF